MQKRGAAILTLFVITGLMAQTNPDVYLCDIESSETKFTLSNFQNISNDEGYDSQPSFKNNETILFAGNRDGQTDIAQYHIPIKAKAWCNFPTSGGEYSPQVFNNSTDVTAVRLDTNGLQRLYRYPTASNSSGGSGLLIDNLQVAYYASYKDEIIVASVLSAGNLDLVVANLQNKKIDTLVKKSGRSIHKIPNKEAISYTALNDDKNYEVYQLDIKDFESYFVCELPVGIQDHIWLDDFRLLLGSGSRLYLFDLFGNQEWEEVANLEKYKIDNISRLALSPDGKKLALVAEPRTLSPITVVQKHIAPYNAGDLQVFVDCFSEEVEVNRFPSERMYQGKKKMIRNYRRFFNKNSVVGTHVRQRITIGNMVIDEEVTMVSGKRNRQATIYKVENEKIKSMTFIQNKRVSESPEAIVQKQLDAYNDRDIDAFLATYTEDVQLYNFPNKVTSEGQNAMRESYAGFFQRTLDLHCEIKNRIIIGNKVIDEEYVTMNGNHFKAVAIYEVENGLISKVTFIQ